MKTYLITFTSGDTLSIDAARFVTDGSGTRLYDSGGEMVAAWSDGQVCSVIPAAAVVAPPEE